MRPGDVFFHNDVYLSEGGIGHLPDLCVTVPVFVDDGGPRSSRSCRRSATTTTSAARCPARCRRSATSVFEEGLMVPPIKLWDQGVPQRGGAAHHDPQLADARLARRRPRRRVLGLPDGRRAGWPSCSTRYGRETVEACFDAIIDKTTETYRREILSKIPDGELRLGGLRRARRRRRAAAARAAHHADHGLDARRAAGARLHRHLAAGQGADQPLRRLRRRQLPEEVAGADPAQPRRHPGADGRARRQRGRRAADRDAVPAARARCSPRSSRRRPTPARS